MSLFRVAAAALGTIVTHTPRGICHRSAAAWQSSRCVEVWWCPGSVNAPRGSVSLRQSCGAQGAAGPSTRVRHALPPPLLQDERQIAGRVARCACDIGPVNPHREPLTGRVGAVAAAVLLL